MMSGVNLTAIFLISGFASRGGNYNNNDSDVTPPGGVKKPRLVVFPWVGVV